MKDLEACDRIAEQFGLNDEELAQKSALQADSLSVYRIEERNCIQKSKLK